MSHPKNYIQINGRKYHAQTGQPFDSDDSVNSSAPTGISIKVDDVSRPSKPGKSNNVARSVKHGKAKSTQKSTTLMRPAVKKPKFESARKHETKAEPRPPAIKHAPHERLRRAEEVNRSPRIKRFSASTPKPDVIKRRAELPVVQQKTIAPQKQNAAQETIHHSVDQFEQVIHEATSHLETYAEEHRPKNFRKLAYATVSLSVILLCGFVAYQAVPAAKVKLAGNKAGFSADLPGYTPAGYGLRSDIAATSGEVTLAYNSRTDDKGYVVQQQPSNWNSQSLANNFLLAENKPYQTYEQNGKTVYIYEKTNATWVDGGIWYRVAGDASLTSDQLLRIAEGL